MYVWLKESSSMFLVGRHGGICMNRVAYCYVSYGACYFTLVVAGAGAGTAAAEVAAADACAVAVVAAGFADATAGVAVAGGIAVAAPAVVVGGASSGRNAAYT